MFEESENQLMSFDQGPIKPNSSNQGNAFDDFMSKSLDEISYDAFTRTKTPKSSLESLTEAKDAGIEWYNREDVDRFTMQSDYDPFGGFNPANGFNEQQYALNETFLSALGKGLSGAATNFSNQFVDWFKSYGRIADAIVNWDMDLMELSEQEQLEQAYKNRENSFENYVFLKEGVDPDGIFNKRTMAEFISNSGFALGTAAAFASELAASAAITYFSGGAASPLLAATIAKLGKVGTGLTNIAKGVSLGNKSAEAIRASATLIDDAARIANGTSRVSQGARTVFRNTAEVMTNNATHLFKSKTAGQFAFNATKLIPLVGDAIVYGEKMVAAGKAGYSAAHLAGIGLQGGRRLLQTVNMSATEAAFQGVETYSDAFDKMMSYNISKGEDITADMVLSAKQKALEASSSDFKTNLAILTVTNAIQFGSLFNKYLPHNKLMRELFMDNADDILSVTGKTAMDTKLYKQGLFGTYGNIGAIAKDFGKRRAAWEFSKAFGKDFLKFEVTEGLQENLQETSSAAWKDYYVNQYKGVESTLTESFEKGLEEQFTKQGFKTFLMGAFTGSIIRIPNAIINKTIEGLNNKVSDSRYSDPKENPRLQAKEQIIKDIESINAGFASMRDKTMRNNLVNLARHININRAQATSALNNDQKTFQDLKDDAVLSTLFAAQRTNTVDALIDGLRSMEDMTAEEFKNAYGVELTELGVDNTKDLFNKTADRLKKYSDTIDDLRKNVARQIDVTTFGKNSTQKFIAGLFNQAQEEAVQRIAYDVLKGEMISERAKEISQKLLQNPAVANSSDTILRTLENARSLKAEMGFLGASIKTLENQLKLVTTGDARKEIQKELELKEKELELLRKWGNFFVDGPDGQTSTFKGRQTDIRREVTDDEGNVTTIDAEFDLKHDEVKSTLQEIVNLKNEQLKLETKLSDANLTQFVDDYIDYITLNEDVREHMKSVDALTDPKHLLATINDGVVGIYKFNILVALEHIERFPFYIAQDVTRAEQIENEQEEDERFITLYNLIQSELHASEPYKKLLALVSQEEIDVVNDEYRIGLINEIEKFFDGIRARYNTITEPQETIIDDSDGDVNTEVEPESQPAPEPPPVSTPNDIPPDLDTSQMEQEVFTKSEMDPSAPSITRAEWDMGRAAMGQPPVTDEEWAAIVKDFNKIQVSEEKPSVQVEEPTTSVPLTITTQVRQQLYDLGYNKADVNKMRPEDAQSIIKNQTTKKSEQGSIIQTGSPKQDNIIRKPFTNGPKKYFSTFTEQGTLSPNYIDSNFEEGKHVFVFIQTSPTTGVFRRADNKFAEIMMERNPWWFTNILEDIENESIGKDTDNIVFLQEGELILKDGNWVISKKPIVFAESKKYGRKFDEIELQKRLENKQNIVDDTSTVFSTESIQNNKGKSLLSITQKERDGEIVFTAKVFDNGAESLLEASTEAQLYSMIDEYYSDDKSATKPNKIKEYAVVENEEQKGFDIVDDLNIPLNAEPIQSEEKANKTAAKMNGKKSDIDFVIDLVNKHDDHGKVDPMIYDKLVTVFTNSMKRHNKTKGTKYTTLQQFNKSAEGAAKILNLYNSHVRGKSPKQTKAKTVKKVTSTKKKENINNDFENIPDISEQELGKRLLEMFESVKPIAENQDKNVNFVDDTSLNELFDDLNPCI